MYPYSRSLIFIYFSEVILSFHVSSVMTLLTSYAEDIGAGPTLQGVIAGAYSITEVFSNSGLGWLSDRYGREPIVYFANILMSVSVAATGIVRNKWYLLILRLITGLFGGGVLPVGQAAVGDNASTREENNFLMSRISMSVGLGFVLGPLLILILSRFNKTFEDYCYILGISTTILLFFWIFFIPKIRKFQRPSGKKFLTTKEKSPLLKRKTSGNEILTKNETLQHTRKINTNGNKSGTKEGDGDENEDFTSGSNEIEIDNDSISDSENEFKLLKKQNNISPRWKLVCNIDVLLLLLLNLVFVIPFIQLLSSMPLLIKNIFHLKITTYASLTMIFKGLSMSLSSFIYVPTIIKKIGPIYSFYISTVIQSLALLSLYWLHVYWMWCCAFIIYIFFFSVHLTLASSLLVLVSPKNMEGMLLGIAQVVQAISRAVSPIYGMIFFHKSYFLFTVSLAVTTSLTFPIALKLHSNKKKLFLKK
ncbi:multidrug resistance protein mdtg [Anaeramoeba flamelloides]|uniref:Multidrug resistance protein mdtg n=1 Tax=Anaeramoeba flamelloides TaxID=1746091 RepID=A0AAV7YH38_9EUKA|nr:multidrug resistance protein mdtg [Anaeramoeba flamelloides]